MSIDLNPERWRQIKKIFEKVTTLTPEERIAYLNEHCGTDEDLRAELESLVHADTSAGNFLEAPVLGDSPNREIQDRLVGKKIGQYELTRVISTGGMGIVYEALQEHPLRIVAIKLMKDGISSRSAQRRFEYESQILAHLKHPGIAQVIEAGTFIPDRWSDGRENEGGSFGTRNGDEPGLPYFVMEYIPDARPITRFALRRKLSVHERISLFMQVCAAVQHGHQKGIIHRDLKPGNILIDGSGQVKIIDFGVARATDSDLRLTTQQTDVGQLIGTLQYMSPEQCKADPNDLDIRSDVYALGVVLYELLCETLPYDVKRTAVFEAARLIREEPPMRPSSVNRLLRGDVETILLKALEKDRADRYGSVTSFAADLDRHLKGELILARPAGFATRILKRMKRNPVLSTSVFLCIVSLLAFFLYVVCWSYPRIKAEQVRAVTALSKARVEKEKAQAAQREADSQRQAALDAMVEAEREAKKARAVNEFIEDMLSSPDPASEGHDVKVADLLDGAAERLGGSFEDEPEIEASLRRTIGWTYRGLGRYKKAVEQIESALEICERELGDKHPETLDNRSRLGQLLGNLGRFSEAEHLLRDLLEVQKRVLGEEHRDTLATGAHLFHMLYQQGKLDEAEAILKEVMEAQIRVLGEGNTDTIFSMVSYAKVLIKKDELEKARVFFDRAYDAARTSLGEDHLVTLGIRRDEASLFETHKKYPQAEKLLVDVLDRQCRTLGKEHIETLHTLYSLGYLYLDEGRPGEAEKRLSLGIEIAHRLLPERHFKTADLYTGYGTCLSRQNRFGEAEEYLKKGFEIRKALFGEANGRTQASVKLLIELYEGWKKAAQAERWRNKLISSTPRRRDLQ